MIKHHIITAKQNWPKQCHDASKKQFFMRGTFVGFPIPYNHYRNPGLCRVPVALPSAFYRALGKADFAERRTRQSPALGKELVYRV
jgi:hypothetical protein